jgi:hypothetical protein
LNTQYLKTAFIFTNPSSHLFHQFHSFSHLHTQVKKKTEKIGKFINFVTKSCHKDCLQLSKEKIKKKEKEKKRKENSTEHLLHIIFSKLSNEVIKLSFSYNKNPGLILLTKKSIERIFLRNTELFYINPVGNFLNTFSDI